MRRVLLLLLTVLVVTGTTSPAQAHTRLVSSTPAAGTPVAGVREVVLVFSEPVQSALSAVAVTGADGRQWADGALRGDGTTVRQALAAPLPAGTYDVSYRVLAADGHPVTGSLELTATAPAAPAATATASAEPTATVSPTTVAADVPVGRPTSSSGAGGLPLLPLVAAGLAVAAVVGLLARRAGATPRS